MDGYHRVVSGALASILLCAALSVAQQRLRPRDVDAIPSKKADARIAYGPDPLNYGDLRLPPGNGPFPVAIIVHGGCWISKFAALDNTSALSDGLRDAGVATWNVEYRRLDQAGGGWPGTFTDIAAAAEPDLTVGDTIADT